MKNNIMKFLKILTVIPLIYLTAGVDGKEIKDGTITGAKISNTIKDASAATASLRTLGTSASQAAAGNHTHTSSGVTDFSTAVNTILSSWAGSTNLTTLGTIGTTFRINSALASVNSPLSIGPSTTYGLNFGNNSATAATFVPVINFLPTGAATDTGVVQTSIEAAADSGNTALLVFNFRRTTPAAVVTRQLLDLQNNGTSRLTVGPSGVTSNSCSTSGGTCHLVTGDALTTGMLAQFKSNSSSGSTRTLVKIDQQNSSATSSTPFAITQSAITSTHFKLVTVLAGVTFWVSDGTTPSGNLTGTSGDICLNGPSGQPFYSGGGTTWTGM